ncbi:MAG: hypothetical protein IKK17_00850 [Oscillospiraceae bacterium]|nr:hypothetical protein [Oscillospiraceae bacterium]
MMSVKSRNRYNKKQSEAVPRSPLAFQKQYIHAAMVEYAIKSGIFFFCACLGIEPFFDSPPFFPGYFAASAFFCFFSFYMIGFIRSFRIHRALGKVQYASEESRTLHCCKCTFLFKSVSKHTSRIVCIIMKDEQGNRFCYVYPEKEAPFDSAKKQLKARFVNQDLTLTCYQGTNLIKVLPKMPHFP